MLIKRHIKNANSACSAIMSGKPAIKRICRVLCRMISMVKNIATDPPNAAITSKACSEMRRFLRAAAILSYIVATMATSERIAK